MLPRRPRSSSAPGADRYLGYDRQELDAQYDVDARAGDGAEVVRQLCRRLSEEARSRFASVRDTGSEAPDAPRLDIFPAAAPGAPVVAFVPGAFWRATDRAAAAHVALGLVPRGAAVAIVGHDAVADVGMAGALDQVCRAVLWLRDRVADFNGDGRRIVLAGHGSGAHLAALSPTADWPRLTGVEGATCPLAAVAGLSGIYDLEPVRRSYLNVELALDAASVGQLSPVRLVPALARPGPRFLLAVGARESDEFHRHLAGYARALDGHGARVSATTQPDLHHLSVTAELASPSSDITNRLIALTEAADTADTGPM